jgi:hypothetical protein
MLDLSPQELRWDSARNWKPNLITAPGNQSQFNKLAETLLKKFSTLTPAGCRDLLNHINRQTASTGCANRHKDNARVLIKQRGFFTHSRTAFFVFLG